MKRRFWTLGGGFESTKRQGGSTMALKKKARLSTGAKAAKMATKKSAVKTAPKLTRYSKGEHIKVAPLHSPKPTMTIDELSQAREERSDSELFDGDTPPA